MAASGGAGVLVQALINGVYTTIGGTREKSLKLNAQEVDVTNSDSAGRWRELIGNVGVKSLDADVSGVVLGTAEQKFLINAAMNGTQVTMKVVIPGVGAFEGPFLLSAADWASKHDDAIPYAFTVKSAGALSFT